MRQRLLFFQKGGKDKVGYFCGLVLSFYGRGVIFGSQFIRIVTECVQGDIMLGFVGGSVFRFTVSFVDRSFRGWVVCQFFFYLDRVGLCLRLGGCVRFQYSFQYGECLVYVREFVGGFYRRLMSIQIENIGGLIAYFK